MQDNLVEEIIKQEIQLLERIDPPHLLAELIDNDFIEIGSSATVYNKAEVIRWLYSEEGTQNPGEGVSFKAYPLAHNLILLTYISALKDKPINECKQAMRSSIWRLTEGQWRMVFHQGTPIKSPDPS